MSEIPHDKIYEDFQAKIEAEVYQELLEETKYGEITPEQCEELFAEWLKKYRN